MIIKDRDDKTVQINELESLLPQAAETQRKRIEEELRNVRAGGKAEKDAAYLIDFDFRDSKNTAVIHDLRLEINGRVAQIDHLIISRTMDIFVLESKSFHAGMKITEEGEFLKWNDRKKTFEGIPSPLAQNDRHITVLKDALNRIDLPSRMGLKLTPSLHSVVLIDSKVRIDRPKHFDTGNIIKADMLTPYLDKAIERKSDGLNVFGALAKVVSREAIEQLARGLVALHKPSTFDYKAKFGISESALQKAKQQMVAEPAKAYGDAKLVPACRACGSTKLSIQYGKFGYYFKCADCDGNMPIKIGCGHEGHKERLRKEGPRFFRECADCGTSTLYFVNQ